MADENNSSDKAATEEVNKEGDNQEPASPAPDGSKKPEITPEEQARREQQSAKDRAAGGKDEFSERIDFLEAREMERVRGEYVSDLLTSETETYPNVQANDPLFKFATSKEDVKEIATQLQNRFTEQQQAALQSVQTQSDQSLTDEEIAEREKELEKETTEHGRSTFGQYFNNLTNRRKG